MADRRDLSPPTKPELELALVDLGRSLAWPTVTPVAATAAGEDAAARARRRIVSEGIRPSPRSRWERLARRRPVRSSLVLAAAALLLLAAIAAAIGLGLPGIRITFTSSPFPSTSPPSVATPSVAASEAPTPTATIGSAALGWQLGLGEPVDVGDLATSAGFPPRLPPTLPPPSSAWNLEGRLSVVWPSSSSLPPLEERDLGLVLTEFRGDVDAGYFDKILRTGTTIQPTEVDGVIGYWISGRPHELVFVDPSGEPVFDSRRIVGDTLIWAKDGITYRLETALDRDAAVELANSLR